VFDFAKAAVLLGTWEEQPVNARYFPTGCLGGKLKCRFVLALERKVAAAGSEITLGLRSLFDPFKFQVEGGRKSHAVA
jgi:hypothetical protein